MGQDQAYRLARLYGGECEAVVQLGAEPLTVDGHVVKGEIAWAMEQEFAHNLEDVLYRRTRAALYNPDEMLKIIEPAADIMAASLGWSEVKRIEELASVRKRFKADTAIAGC